MVRIIFPWAIVIICRWHAKNTIDEYTVAIPNLPPHLQHYKMKIRDNFHVMLYSKEESNYLAAWTRIVEMGEHHVELQNAASYMSENWHANREMWAGYLTSKYQLFSNFTNNRSEGYNRVYKQEVGTKQNIFDAVKSFSRWKECNAITGLLQLQTC